MAVRTSIDIPEPLYQALRERAVQQRTSIRAIVLRAIEQHVNPQVGGQFVTGPLLDFNGEVGPLFPVNENPHDLILP